MIAFAGISLAQVKDYQNVNFKKYLTTITARDSVISLPDKFILRTTLTVFSDSAEVSPSDYSVDYRFGKVFLSPKLMKEILSDSTRKKLSIIITYRNLPFDIPDTYSRFEVLTKLDTLKKDTVQV